MSTARILLVIFIFSFRFFSARFHAAGLAPAGLDSEAQGKLGQNNYRPELHPVVKSMAAKNAFTVLDSAPQP